MTLWDLLVIVSSTLGSSCFNGCWNSTQLLKLSSSIPPLRLALKAPSHRQSKIARVISVVHRHPFLSRYDRSCNCGRRSIIAVLCLVIVRSLDASEILYSARISYIRSNAILSCSFRCCWAKLCSASSPLLVTLWALHTRADLGSVTTLVWNSIWLRISIFLR
jgi:hypothetical protein